MSPQTGSQVSGSQPIQNQSNLVELSEQTKRLSEIDKRISGVGKTYIAPGSIAFSEVSIALRHLSNIRRDVDKFATSKVFSNALL